MDAVTGAVDTATNLRAESPRRPSGCLSSSVRLEGLAVALAACFLPPALTTLFRETAGHMDTPRVSACRAIGDFPSHVVFVDAGVHCAALRLRGGAHATHHSSPVFLLSADLTKCWVPRACARPQRVQRHTDKA